MPCGTPAILLLRYQIEFLKLFQGRVATVEVKLRPWDLDAESCSVCRAALDVNPIRKTSVWCL